MRMLGVAEGECDEDPNSSFPCVSEKGWSHLYLAVDLWNLVDPERGEELLQFIQFVEQPDEQGRIIVAPWVALQMAERLADLDEALLRITDRNHRLRSDTVEKVLAQDPLIVDSWEEDGKTIHTLANNLQDVRNVQIFLQRAMSLGREIEFEWQ